MNGQTSRSSRMVNVTTRADSSIRLIARTVRPRRSGTLERYELERRHVEHVGLRARAKGEDDLAVTRFDEPELRLRTGVAARRRAARERQPRCGCRCAGRDQDEGDRE